MTALTTCMVSPAGLNVQTLKSYAAAEASSGAIDSLSNLKGERVFIWHGTEDHTVNPGIMGSPGALILENFEV